ncbi:MAG: hypothetical protein NDI94_02150 [Candidatus Woesearchaeota archaeon]|nr:hypothetical protein [Candidatus Woesearchaeota archaeon]
MNKRGDLEISLNLLIDIILLAVVILIFAQAVVSVSTNTDFLKRFSAKNVALMTDTAYTSPYPLEVMYKEKTYGFTYDFNEESVDVIEGAERTKYEIIRDTKKDLSMRTIAPVEIDGEKIVPILLVTDTNSLVPVSALPKED